jgi:hypothetical protein
MSSSSGDPLIGAHHLLRRCRDSLDAQSLGSVVVVLQEALFPRRPRAGVMSLIAGASLESFLADAEFVEGVGRARLHSARLLRVAFSRATEASAITAVAGMAAAGALNVYSQRALAALHAGMAGWRLELAAELVGRLCEGVDSFGQAGLFLSLLLGSAASRFSLDDACLLVRSVVAREDVRDLAGRVQDLLIQLPRAVADEAEDEIAARDSSDDEDEDEDGNLRGFIVYSDEDEDGSRGSGSGSGDGSGDDSSSDGGGDGRGKKRRRDRGGSSESDNGSGRRRGGGAGRPSSARKRARSQQVMSPRAAALRAKYGDLEAGVGR